jgi:hypothetical protein
MDRVKSTLPSPIYTPMRTAFRAVHHHNMKVQAYPTMSPETRSSLNARFLDTVMGVEQWLGRPIPHWHREGAHARGQVDAGSATS